MTRRDRVCCGKCDGTGRALLSEELQRTLDMCRKMASRSEAISSPSVIERMPARFVGDYAANPTAMNNRLVKLARAGFLRRLGRVSREIVYEVVR